MEAGVPVTVGTDNVCDAFCPVGRHDPRQSLMFAILAAHLGPQLGDCLPMISSTAQRALGLKPIYVDDAKLDDLILFDAASTAELLAGVEAPYPLMQKIEGVFQ